MRRLIVDMSSVTWRGLLAGTDTEFGYTVEHEGKKVKVNSAAFGYENVMNAILSPMKKLGIVPSNVILVIEGESSKSYRRNMLPTYKEGDSRPPEAYTEFNKTIQLVKGAFLAVGAKACSQPYIESDDVIAHLAKTLAGERVILSEDGDLSILTDLEGVTQWRQGEILDKNPYGPWPTKYITLYKSLVGDPSDNIKGAWKFGKQSFLDLYVRYGDEGMDSLEAMITCPSHKRDTEGLGLLIEDVGDFNALQRIMDSADEVYVCYQAAKLYPDQIDTRRKPLSWEVGMVKPLTTQTDERLRPWAGRVRLVHADNYDDAMAWAKTKVAETPFLSLDIETSTPPESDQWVEDNKKKSGDRIIDVYGSELTSMSLTFGDNGQYTLYFTVDHLEEPGVPNCTSEQARLAVEAFFGRPIVIQNVSFELTVLYQAWAEAWKDDPDWHGFLPNTHDTKIMGSYVNENISNGLKGMSKHYLGYDQQNYAETTQFSGEIGTLPVGGVRIKSWEVQKTQAVFTPVVDPDSGEEVCREEDVVVLDADGEPVIAKYMETREYKMAELTANHVLHYGTDDTICTAALYSHFRMMMEREATWEVYKEVEILPAYLTALAFVQGTPISMSRLMAITAEDAAKEAESWKYMKAELVSRGWSKYAVETHEKFSPASVKQAFLAAYGIKLETAIRTPKKIAAFILQNHSDLLGVEAFAEAVMREDVAFMNGKIEKAFVDNPVLDLDSPKEMRTFLYDFLGLPVRIINKVTATERKENMALTQAVKLHNAINAGKGGTLRPEDMKLLKLKAKTDDTAVEFALLYDADETTKPLLKAIQTLKTVATRRKLYYNNYPSIPHWKDGLVHAHVNQCGTITRRYSSSGPNLQQLPKLGEGVKFRGIFVPHEEDAVICSIDFSGQELRLGAYESQDPNMLACYVGDNKKDMHSITAAGAMTKKWGGQYVSEMQEKFGTTDHYALFLKLHKSDNEETAKKADDLRKVAKNVNFGAQYDAQAPTLAETIVIPVADAQLFLDAKYAMFPRFEVWKDEVKASVEKLGYATTLLGARRHLRDNLASNEYGVADKAKRQGPNFKIQGGSAEQTKLAMARLWRSGAMFKYRARFIAPIHDELVTSVHRDDALEFIKIKHDCMVEPYATMTVPTLGSISLGLNFCDQHECGDWYIPEKITSALNTCFPQ